MFVVIQEFPPLKEGMDEEFRKWFAWTNDVYSKHRGFISRRLMEPVGREGPYVAIIEHETRDTFMEMHDSEDRSKAFAKLRSLLKGGPQPRFYQVVPEFYCRI